MMSLQVAIIYLKSNRLLDSLLKIEEAEMILLKDNIFMKIEIKTDFFTFFSSKLSFTNNNIMHFVFNSGEIIKSIQGFLKFRCFFVSNFSSGVLNQFMTAIILDVLYIKRSDEKTIKGKIPSFIMKGNAEYINVTESTFIRLQSEEDGGVY